MLPDKGDQNIEQVYHQFVIQYNERDKLKEYLKNENIHTSIHYPVPVHLQKGYKDSILVPFPLRNTENIISKILSLPIYPELSNQELKLIVSRLVKFQKIYG